MSCDQICNHLYHISNFKVYQMPIVNVNLTPQKVNILITELSLRIIKKYADPNYVVTKRDCPDIFIHVYQNYRLYLKIQERAIPKNEIMRINEMQMLKRVYKIIPKNPEEERELIQTKKTITASISLRVKMNMNFSRFIKESNGVIKNLETLFEILGVDTFSFKDHDPETIKAANKLFNPRPQLCFLAAFNIHYHDERVLSSSLKN